MLSNPFLGFRVSCPIHILASYLINTIMTERPPRFISFGLSRSSTSPQNCCELVRIGLLVMLQYSGSCSLSYLVRALGYLIIS